MNTRRTFLGSLFSGSLALLAGKSASVRAEASLSSPPLPVCHETDICVLGGSATGVFAAVRAARLGARVAIVERANGFGGVAVNSLVNVWHPLYDTQFERKIIAGLTEETVARLHKRNAVDIYDKNPSVWAGFNSSELKIELDELVVESKIRPFLHTLFSEPYYESGDLTGVIIDGKSGRRVIKARVFIDATGDGDLCVRMGFGSRLPAHPQPPTMCAHLDGFDLTRCNNILAEHAKEYNIPRGFLWGLDIPGTHSFMFAGTRVYDAACAEADDLTAAEIEGRRQVRAVMDMYRRYAEGASDARFGLTALPSALGIRESRHIDCLYRVTDDDAMYGKRLPDAIANCSYTFDLHHDTPNGHAITFRGLDGSEERYGAPGAPPEIGRWRPETAENPTFYQIPFRSIVPKGSRNVLLAGRMFDAEEIAFSGMRVMVNMNQLGEAAGVAAYLALEKDIPVGEIDAADVRRTLAAGGSVII